MARTFAVAITLILLSAVVGESAAAWRQSRFLIGGWGVNDAPLHSDRLLLLQQAGLDFVQNSDHGFDPRWGERLVTRLDTLRAARPDFRLQAILHVTGSPGRPSGFSANPAGDANWPSIRQTLEPSQRLNRASTLGWFVWDEPCTRAEMDQATRMVRHIRANPATTQQVPFINLLPIAMHGGSGCYEREFGPGLDRLHAYAAYLDAYLRAFDSDPQPAPLLSFDHYPFQVDGHEDGSYFENLAVVRDRALAHGRPGDRVPLWVVIQLASFKPAGAPFMHNPTIAQVRWQAWTAVAYGAKSISYWTTGTTADPHPQSTYAGGLLELDGRPTAKYRGVRQLNAELHAFGPTLMKLDPVTVLQVDPGGQDVAPSDRIGSPDRVYDVVSAVDGAGAADCMIGYFKHQATADDYLLVVNKSLSDARDFRLHLGSRADSIVIIDPASGRARLVGRALDLLDVRALPPASAALYRLAGPVLEHLRGVREVRREGPVRQYQLADRVLLVDYSTGVRRLQASGGGAVDPNLRITPEGVRRPAGWLPWTPSEGP